VQRALNAGAFSGNERNERAQGHCPFVDVDALAACFPPVDDRIETRVGGNIVSVLSE
jgi:hypothetical protein